MNNLSWLLYLADVTGSVSTVLSIAATVSGAACIVLFIWSAVLAGSSPTIWSWDDKETKIAAHKAATANCKKYGFVTLRVAIPAALVASLIPSQNTVYAIAASQTSEQVLKSQTAQKAVQALNHWLDKQISDSK